MKKPCSFVILNKKLATCKILLKKNNKTIDLILLLYLVSNLHAKKRKDLFILILLKIFWDLILTKYIIL